MNQSLVLCLLACALAAPALAQDRPEVPLKAVDVFVDQPDNLATRIKVQTNSKGEFSVPNLKSGMYRIVVQTTDVAPGDKNAGPENVGVGGLRNATVFGQPRRTYGRIKYVTLYVNPTSSSGSVSMNQKLVNGRTAGIVVNVMKPGEVLSGKVKGSQ
ncbi:MAG: hypothetical protein V4562_08645 [Pseudomonadota bacterium]